MNALRHGLTGQVTTMTDEDRAAHDTFSKALLKDLAPEGAMEIQLAQRVATDSWRLNRISAIRLTRAVTADFTRFKPRKFHAQAA